MTNKSKPTPATLPFVPAIAIFGLDDRGKPHAAIFETDDIELATRAAAMMRMTALQLATDESRQAAQGLAQGRIFASGRALAPFCRRPVYDALAACGGEVPSLPEGYEPMAGEVEKATLPPPHASIPSTLADIEIGSLLLAPEVGENAGWYEVRVIELKPEGLAVLKWVGWPAEPKMVRRLDSLGFLPAVDCLEDVSPAAGDAPS